MIADLIRLGALYVLTRVFVEITMPSSKYIVKYLFYAGVALTIVSSIGPYLTRVLDDVHNVSVAYTETKEATNSLLGGSDQVLDVGYQSIFEKWLGNANFDWPIKGKVTQEFKSEEHHGIDISGDVGDKIKAARPGKVKQIGKHEIYGLFVILDHGNKWETLYAHCSKVVVSEGQPILNRDKIAEVGSSGKSTGAHLHFEIRQGGKAINPTKYL